LPLRFLIRASPARARGGPDFSSPASERWVEIPCETGEVVIGRHAGATIELPFSVVSGRHARLFHVDDSYRIEDLGSANGTWLGGRRLLSNVSEVIAVGETIGIAGIDVVFEGELPCAGQNPLPESTATLSRRLVHDIFETCPPAECARLVVLEGPAQGRELVLAALGRAFLIGRGNHCDLALQDDDVSREHAALERSADGIVARDLGSKNGVEVQGQRIAGPRHLCDGEIVRVGETYLRVIDPEQRYLRQMQEADAHLIADSVTPLLEAKPTIGANLLAGHPSATVPVRQSRMPVVAVAMATTVLLSLLSLVLALAFGAWK
jgi:pSer/pThr/pTyr-binding forkhead associated (FHA) protein